MFPGIKNQFLRFTFNLLILFLILFVIDRVAGNITKRFYFSQVAGANYRTTYAMDSTKADILVFGSSRASHHYVPEVFEDSLKMSFYNTGRDGNFLLYNTAIFKTIIKRYNPKIIILDINPGDLNYNKEDYDRLSSLLPYYENHPEIKPIIELRGPYEKYKLLSAIYPFNSCLTTIMVGNLELNKKRKFDHKGYIPLFGRIQDPILTNFMHKQIDFDTTKIQTLTYISKICKSKNIKLLFIQSPLYARTTNDTSTDLITKIADKNGAFFLNYVNDSIFIQHPAYYKDINHLNNDGAFHFSSIIAHWLIVRNFEKQETLLN